MPYGKYLPEGRASTRLPRNVAKEEPPRRPHHGQPDPRTQKRKAPGRTRPPACPSRAPGEPPMAGNARSTPSASALGVAPVPEEMQALLTRLTVSILYLRRVVSLNCFLSTGFEETCLGKKAGWSWVSAWVGGTKRAPRAPSRLRNADFLQNWTPTYFIISHGAWQGCICPAKDSRFQTTFSESSDSGHRPLSFKNRHFLPFS